MEKCLILLSVLVLVWSPPGQADETGQVPDYCKLFPENGPGPSCLAYIPQFFYNSTSEECEEFIYGGCGGNKNRFGSKKKCMETCNPQPTLLVREVMEESILPRGCVRPRPPHHRDNACSQPVRPGPCLGYFPQYFYNSTSNKCEIFIYGGCRGNRNRFESLTTCQMYCRAVPVFNATEVCNLPPETGPCRAAFQKLYYNPDSQRCEPFIYGGCDGNDNKFDSVKDCMRTCNPEDSDEITPLVQPKIGLRGKTQACDQPPETGRCRANIPRYFYNSTSHECEQFTYGGCGGNDNKFVTKRGCNLTCKKKPVQPTDPPGTDTTDVCHLPANPGPCEALIPRYHYNHNTKKCEEFGYGGCGGNKNNFIDEDECLKACQGH